MDESSLSIDFRNEGAGFVLPDTKAQLQQMVAALPGMLWTADAQGRVDFVSPQWLMMTGLKAENLLGSGWLDAVHPDDRNAAQSAWAAAIDYPRGIMLEFRLRDRHGNYRWFTSRATPIFDAIGKVGRWFGLCVDIDHLKQIQHQLAESERRYAKLFENKSNGIAFMRVIYDDHGKAQDIQMEKVNAAYARITGQSPGQVEGRLLADIFPGIQDADVDYLGTCDYIARHASELRFVVDFSYLNQWLAIYAYSAQPGECIAIFTDVTAQKKAEAALRESEERMKFIIDNLAEGLIVVSPDGENLHWNHTAMALHGYSEQGEQLHTRATIAQDYEIFTLDGKRLPYEEWPIPRLLRGETVQDFEATLCNIRHHWQRVLSYGGVLVRDSSGQPLMGLLTIRDISERKRAEDARKDAERRLQLAVDIAHLGSWEWSVANNKVYFSPQWKRLIGYADDELPDQVEQWSTRLHPSDRADVLQKIAAFVKQPLNTLKLEYRMRHRDGSYRWMIAQAIANIDADGQRATHLIGTMLDVTEQKVIEQRVREAAQHDVLTGLPNRALIIEYAGHLLSSAARKYNHVALLFIDLDRFKPVNDLYGHEIGDKLLREVSGRLIGCVRHGDIVGRIGGDEFVIILPYLGKEYSASTVAQHVTEALSQPFQIGELDLSISASIGISLFPQHGEDIDALLHTADLAMYYAKEKGRAGFHMYTPELNSHKDASSSIEARLKDGLLNKHLFLLYQPVIDMENGEIIGVEALLRLPLNGHEAVGPDRFIPVAESAGLIGEIGDWVAAEVCRQHEEWCLLGLPPVTISMNVSSLQFRQRGFVGRLLDIVHQSHVEPHCLQIEINENTVMDSIDDAIATLDELHAAGIRIALDDFGTGYSSLEHLSQLPLDILKVDQSIVQKLSHNKSSQAIADAIIAIGKSLNMVIVGEGIESQQSMDYLRLHGCGQAQGNFFSQPLPAAEFVSWYRAQHLPQASHFALGTSC